MSESVPETFQTEVPVFCSPLVLLDISPTVFKTDVMGLIILVQMTRARVPDKGLETLASQRGAVPL